MKNTYTKSAETLYELWLQDKSSLIIRFLGKFGREFNYNTFKTRNDIEKVKENLSLLDVKNKRYEYFLKFYEKNLNEKVIKLKTAKKEKLDILEAEVFWRMILNSQFYLGYDFKNIENIDLEKELRSFLGEATNEDIYNLLKKVSDSTTNSYLKIVCKILALPNIVWKELLYRKNIDFQSFESFLRRLKSEQYEAIDIAHKQLFEDKIVPIIFSQDKKIRQFFKKVPSYDKIIDSYYNFSEKYSSKGAMSYDLFNLDFGYGRFPNGISDDTEVVEKDLSRFISIKNHVNDFVVNKRDGGYWYMYKKARSNYVYMPDKEIKLSTHICPGFWYTLMVHLLFWIISPLAFLATLTIVNFEETFSSLTTYGLASFTFIWSILAIIKYLVLKIQSKKLRTKYSQKTKERFIYTYKKILTTLKIIGVIAAVGGLSYAYIVINYLAIRELSDLILIYKAVMIIIVLNYLSIYVLLEKISIGYVSNFKNWPESLKISIALILAYSLFDFIEYSWGPIAIFIYSMIAFTSLFIYLVIKFEKYLDEDNKQYEEFGTIFMYGTNIFAAIIALIIIYSFLMTNMFLAIAILIILSSLLYTARASIVEKFLLISPNAKRLGENLNIDIKSKNFIVKYHSLLSNEYILSLGKVEQKRIISKISDLTKWINELINEESLKKIDIYKIIDSESKMSVYSSTVKSIRKYRLCDDEKDKKMVTFYFYLIEMGLNKDELIKQMEEKYNKKINKNEESEVIKLIRYKWSKFTSQKNVVFIFALSVLLYNSTHDIGKWFIISLYEALSYLPKLIWKYSLQFWSTYKTFQDACPHVAEQIPLK